MHALFLFKKILYVILSSTTNTQIIYYYLIAHMGISFFLIKLLTAKDRHHVLKLFAITIGFYILPHTYKMSDVNMKYTYSLF